MKAIKEGNVFLGYDAKFFFAEINGDRFIWLVNTSNGIPHDPKLVGSNPGSVGKDISTKAVGSSDKQDITHQYKYAEGRTLKYMEDIYASTSILDFDDHHITHLQYAI